MRLRTVTAMTVLATAVFAMSPTAGVQAAAATGDPTVVRILAGGHLQVSTPDDAADVEVSGGTSVVLVQDFKHEVVGVDPCVRRPAQNLVECPAPGVSSVTVLTGAGNDLVQTFTDLPVVLVTNGGNDDVRDGFSRDALVLLGAGDDEADSGTGPTDVFGGDGTDTIAYTVRSTGVAVTLDDVADDGAPGENDNIHSDVENILGSTAADVLVGSSIGNRIAGFDGDDVINGLEGPDTLDGGPGRDVLDAGPGTDTVTYADHAAPVNVSLDGNANDGQAGERDNVRNAENVIGGSGSDTLTGNAGRNVLRGLAGNDRLFGLAGNDSLIGGAGTDTASGGPGTDTCQAEATLSCP